MYFLILSYATQQNTAHIKTDRKPMTVANKILRHKFEVENDTKVFVLFPTAVSLVAKLILNENYAYNYFQT